MGGLSIVVVVVFVFCKIHAIWVKFFGFYRSAAVHHRGWSCGGWVVPDIRFQDGLTCG